MGRGSHRLRRREARCRGAGSRARQALPGEHRALQAAQGLFLHRGAAEEQLRQDSQNRAARTRQAARAALGGTMETLTRERARIRPLTAEVGAEALDVDLEQLDQATFDEMRQALFARTMLVIRRDAPLGPDA